MALITHHRIDPSFLFVVAPVPIDRSPAIPPNAPVDTFSISAILGRDLNLSAPEFSVLRIDLYAQPLFPAGLPFYTNANRPRFPATDRFAHSDARLRRPTGSSSR